MSRYCISLDLKPTTRPVYPAEFAKLFDMTLEEFRELEKECIATLFGQAGIDINRPANVVDFRRKQ